MPGKFNLKRTKTLSQSSSDNSDSRYLISPPSRQLKEKIWLLGKNHRILVSIRGLLISFQAKSRSRPKKSVIIKHCLLNLIFMPLSQTDLAIPTVTPTSSTRSISRCFSGKSPCESNAITNKTGQASQIILIMNACLLGVNSLSTC